MLVAESRLQTEFQLEHVTEGGYKTDTLKGLMNIKSIVTIGTQRYVYDTILYHFFVIFDIGKKLS